jgi:hypothetical protein
MGRTLVFSTILLLAACDTASEEILGDWQFDEATYELIQRYKTLSPEMQQHWVDTARMDLSFRDGRLSWKQELPGWGNRSVEGPYRVIESKGNRVTVEATFAERKERLVFTVAEDRLRFGLRGRSIILRRRIPAP